MGANSQKSGYFHELIADVEGHSVVFEEDVFVEQGEVLIFLNLGDDFVFGVEFVDLFGFEGFGVFLGEFLDGGEFFLQVSDPFVDDIENRVGCPFGFGDDRLLPLKTLLSIFHSTNYMYYNILFI